MLSFTQHMKYIIDLSEKTLRHAKAGKFKPAADDLMEISTHTTEAMQQLDDMSLMAYRGKDPAERIKP